LTKFFFLLYNKKLASSYHVLSLYLVIKSKALQGFKKGSQQDNNLDRDIKIENVYVTISKYMFDSTSGARKIDSRDLELILTIKVG
jgi:hypothetical protein